MTTALNIATILALVAIVLGLWLLLDAATRPEDES